jgi:uncharacterized protein (DUF983 family)
MEKLRCPNCQNEMNFITFAKAPTPWHLKCQYCGSNLKGEKYYAITTLAITLFFGMLIGGLCAFSGVPFIPFLLILIAFAVSCEYVFYLLARKLGISLELK